MKKEYQKPEVEIIEIQVVDSIMVDFSVDIEDEW